MEACKSEPIDYRDVLKAVWVGVQAEVAENVSRQQELLSVIASNMSAFKQVYDVDGWQGEINRVAGAPLQCYYLASVLRCWAGRLCPWGGGIIMGVAQVPQDLATPSPVPLQCCLQAAWSGDTVNNFMLLCRC